jgi:hypothetical protein
MLLGIMLLLHCITFLLGSAGLGVTQWAFGGMLLGWLVLLYCVSAGYSPAAYIGLWGLRRSTVSIAVSASAVVLVQGWFRLTGLGIPTPNSEGHAGSIDAFVVQLLTALTILLVLSKTYGGAFGSSMNGRRCGPEIVLCTLPMTGLIWSGSRAGRAVGITLVQTLSLTRRPGWKS